MWEDCSEEQGPTCGLNHVQRSPNTPVSQSILYDCSECTSGKAARTPLLWQDAGVFTLQPDLGPHVRTSTLGLTNARQGILQRSPLSAHQAMGVPGRSLSN